MLWETLINLQIVLMIHTSNSLNDSVSWKKGSSLFWLKYQSIKEVKVSQNISLSNYLLVNSNYTYLVKPRISENLVL